MYILYINNEHQYKIVIVQLVYCSVAAKAHTRCIQRISSLELLNSLSLPLIYINFSNRKITVIG